MPLRTYFIKNLMNKHKKEHMKEPSHPEKDEGKSQLNENYHNAIGRMSAFFAHEIRNPLTSIIGFAQFLERDEAIRANSNTVQYIAIIKEEALKMEVLIEELLSLSKAHLHQDHLSIIDVKQSIEKVVSVYQMQSSYNQIHFKTALADDCYVLGNRNQFERVLINLFKNAIEAMQEEGIIEINVTKKHSFVILEIIDDGPGMSPDDLERIFLPFFTTKEEGSGIGLPICKTIIETMNGSMDISNHISKGIQVVIEIPQSKHISGGNSKNVY